MTAIRIGAAALAALAWCSCTRNAPRPSVLLFVMDTTRTDALSAYGRVEGTTPAADALAREGLMYRYAYANAPWTLPSHVTLFTGLLPDGHGVDWAAPVAPGSLTLLAERLRDAGYETLGYSENPFVSSAFGLTQGFDRFHEGKGSADEFAATLADWLRRRDASRPLFLFVNVMDAHWPYEVRPANPYLPEGVTAEEAAALSQWPPDYMCVGDSRRREFAIQHGLYLGDVAAADAKLGQVRDRLGQAGIEPLLTIVTSDHGEHFGEHGLGGHQFSLHRALLHVPLIVHGVPGVAPAAIDTPVQLADVAPSLAAWLALAADPAWNGRALPSVPDRAAPRDLRAIFNDPARHRAADEPTLARLGRQQANALRTRCAPEDRVWGDMRSLVRYPLQLVTFESFPPALYDLDAEPGAERDLAAERPAVLAEMQAALGARTGGGVRGGAIR